LASGTASAWGSETDSAEPVTIPKLKMNPTTMAFMSRRLVPATRRRKPCPLPTAKAAPRLGAALA